MRTSMLIWIGSFISAVHLVTISKVGYFDTIEPFLSQTFDTEYRYFISIEYNKLHSYTSSTPSTPTSIGLSPFSYSVDYGEGQSAFVIGADQAIYLFAVTAAKTYTYSLISTTGISHRVVSWVALSSYFVTGAADFNLRKFDRATIATSGAVQTTVIESKQPYRMRSRQVHFLKLLTYVVCTSIFQLDTRDLSTISYDLGFSADLLCQSPLKTQAAVVQYPGVVKTVNFDGLANSVLASATLTTTYNINNLEVIRGTNFLVAGFRNTVNIIEIPSLAIITTYTSCAPFQKNSISENFFISSTDIYSPISRDSSDDHMDFYRFAFGTVNPLRCVAGLYYLHSTLSCLTLAAIPMGYGANNLSQVALECITQFCHISFFFNRRYS